jgi:hypothetical protein
MTVMVRDVGLANKITDGNRQSSGRDGPQQRCEPEARIRLKNYVSLCLREAPRTIHPARYLELNAGKLRGFMHSLEQTAALDLDCPPHLEGLSAFDLADAAEELMAAAGRAR